MKTIVRRYSFQNGSFIYTDRREDGSKRARYKPPMVGSRFSTVVNRSEAALALREGYRDGKVIGVTKWIAG